MDDPNFYKSITVSDSKALFDAGNYLHIGADATGGYIRNKKTNKGIRLQNDGTLQYDGSDIITARKVSHNPDDYTVATSRHRLRSIRRLTTQSSAEAQSGWAARRIRLLLAGIRPDWSPK